MKNRKWMNLWRFMLRLVLLCILSMPQLAGAGTAPPIPTGPLDAANGTPDYYTPPTGPTARHWPNS